MSVSNRQVRGTGLGTFLPSDSALFNATSLPSLPATLVNTDTSEVWLCDPRLQGRSEHAGGTPTLPGCCSPSSSLPSSPLPLSQRSLAGIFLFGPYMNLPLACSHRDPSR